VYPLVPAGAAISRINNEIAASTKNNLLSRFGQQLFVIDPAASNLPDLKGKKAGGGEYMAVWSDVLSGAAGQGTELDMVYFAGPIDVNAYFGIGPRDSLGALNAWVDNRAQADPSFQQYIGIPGNRRNFLRYYGIRCSSEYSKGAHDEWNIVVSLNAKRGIGEEIAVYFNGQPIEPGDYNDGAAVGNQIVLAP